MVFPSLNVVVILRLPDGDATALPDAWGVGVSERLGFGEGVAELEAELLVLAGANFAAALSPVMVIFAGVEPVRTFVDPSPRLPTNVFCARRI